MPFPKPSYWYTRTDINGVWNTEATLKTHLAVFFFSFFTRRKRLRTRRAAFSFLRLCLPWESNPLNSSTTTFHSLSLLNAYEHRYFSLSHYCFCACWISSPFRFFFECILLSTRFIYSVSFLCPFSTFEVPIFSSHVSNHFCTRSSFFVFSLAPCCIVSYRTLPLLTQLHSLSSSTQEYTFLPLFLRCSTVASSLL